MPQRGKRNHLGLRSLCSLAMTCVVRQLPDESDFDTQKGLSHFETTPQCYLVIEQCLNGALQVVVGHGRYEYISNDTVFIQN